MKITRAKPCAMRGRNPDNPSDRTPGIFTQQRIEIKDGGVSNCITTVQKDTLYVGKVEIMEETKEMTIEDYLYTAKDGEQYGIFKLSPRECLRLMDVRDQDIDKIMSVNSNTQCLKQAGNSIVVSVLCALFSQLGFKGVKRWNERTAEEREQLISKPDNRRKNFTPEIQSDERDFDEDDEETADSLDEESEEW